MQQCGSNNFARRHILDLGWGKKSNLFFFKSSYGAYQINESGAQSTMQAHILSLRAPTVPGIVSKCQNFFLKVVMLHIKLKGIEHRAPYKHINYPYVHLSRVGSKGQNIYFLKVVMLYIKFKGMEHTAKCKHIFCPQTHPLSPGVGSKGHFF